MIDVIAKAIQRGRTPRYRDRRAWNASELGKDARDLYWSATGVEETNPTDLIGQLKMNCGSAIEDMLVREALSRAHFFGYHLLGTQVDIGGSTPVAVNGRLDALVAQRGSGKLEKPRAVEIKTKYGFGASFFKRSLEPDATYLGQLGYYLKDLSEKGITDEGAFLYMLMGDDCFGDLVWIDCRYDGASGVITAYQAVVLSNGRLQEPRALHVTFNVQQELLRLKKIEGFIERKELPPAEKVYKYPLTPEKLSEFSDANIKKALDGEKVIGDWEIQYSRYKALHLQAQGVELGYTAAELSALEAEYLRRHPKSKLRAVGAR